MIKIYHEKTPHIMHLSSVCKKSPVSKHKKVKINLNGTLLKDYQLLAQLQYF